MPRKDNSDDDADGVEARGHPAEETPRRVLYWWHVPERPGVGSDMLIFAGVWIVTLFVLAVIIGAIVAVTG